MSGSSIGNSNSIIQKPKSFTETVSGFAQNTISKITDIASKKRSREEVEEHQSNLQKKQKTESNLSKIISPITKNIPEIILRFFKKPSSRTNIDDLPNELLAQIFKFLDSKSLSSFSKTSKKNHALFKKLVETNYFKITIKEATTAFANPYQQPFDWPYNMSSPQFIAYYLNDIPVNGAALAESNYFLNGRTTKLPTIPRLKAEEVLFDFIVDHKLSETDPLRLNVTHENKNVEKHILTSERLLKKIDILVKQHEYGFILHITKKNETGENSSSINSFKYEKLTRPPSSFHVIEDSIKYLIETLQLYPENLEQAKTNKTELLKEMDIQLNFALAPLFGMKMSEEEKADIEIYKGQVETLKKMLED